MSFRTILITGRAKLELKLGCMVVREANRTNKIHIGEIQMLILENTAISITASLISELVKKKVKIIFCDEKRNPESELMPCHGSHDTSSKIREQIKWRKEAKDLVWTEIITEKIRKQAQVLAWLKRPEKELLDGYLTQVVNRDETNREGHAAKVYFNALFGKSFTRSLENPINAALNYGYGILLSAFTREIVANGYITQLGLFHDNQFNPYNFASDLMEPFRPLVDILVCEINPDEFEQEEKHYMLEFLSRQILVKDKQQYVTNAIKIYCKSIFEALNENDISSIRFYRNELSIYARDCNV